MQKLDKEVREVIYLRIIGTVTEKDFIESDISEYEIEE